MGLSWDFFGGEKIDIDATVVLINDFGATQDAVFYNQTKSQCGSITHSGDQQDGTAAGFDEVIAINLKDLPNDISYLAVLISSYTGVGFKGVETATVSIM